MSSSNPPVADELCLLARNPFDSGQRALWHLDKIGTLVDCSLTRSRALGPDLELIYAVPQVSKRVASSRIFPHSASLEEIGLAGDALSPRSPTPIAMSPSSIGSGLTVASEGSGYLNRFVRITPKTKLHFFNPVSVSVISLDLSPSMNVVDTSFKSVTTGYHLVDNLVRSLELALRCLAKSPVAIFGDISFDLPFKPKLIVTVVAHGVPDLQVFPLAVGEEVTENSIERIVSVVSKRIKSAIDRLASWMQANHASEQLAGASSCSRTRNACTSLVCQANDITVIVRDCLTAISMTCSQWSLSKAGVNKSIMILTDGVLAHPRKLHYDNILMHLNFVDVALHILQIGGGFAPWSAMGYVSDPDLLRLLAASTPTGLFLQDHHLDPILAGSIQPTPSISANVLWKAWVLKCSPLTSYGGRGGKRSHMPYKALTYQSSVLVRRQGTTSSPKMTPQGVTSYIDHIEASATSRREHTIKLQGIAENKSFELLPPSSASASPIVRKRVSSVDSMPSMDSIDTDSDDETLTNTEGAIQTLKQYLQPEKAKARPYLYKQYKLPGVSVGQIVQIRAREGFLIDAIPSSNVTSNSRSSLTRVGSIGGSLARTNSTVSLQGLSPNGPGSSDAIKRSVSMSMHWGPVMDVIYEVTSSSCDAPDDEYDSYLSRPSEEVRIKVYLRMPSGEFFLRFKQQLAAPPAASGTETNFWQMCRQLDAFIDAIFSVDDTLTKLTCPRSAKSVSAKRSVSDHKMAPPLMQRQSSLSVLDNRRSSTSLDKIAEHSSSMAVLPSSLSQESLFSVASSSPPSPPLTPLEKPLAASPVYQPPVEIEASLLKQVLPKDVSTWHRWFTVRNLFVILDVSAQTASQRVRHGSTAPLLAAAREELIDEVRHMAHSEMESQTRFYCKISEWDRVNDILSNSHTTNVLSRTNDALIARLNSGDARIATVTDSVLPFMVLDIAAQTHDSSLGVVKITAAMFGCCPAAERAAVDHISHAISAGVLVDAPSPIFRAIQAGLLTHTVSAGQLKKQVSKKQGTSVVATGMGNGDSFYTYNPDGVALNRFMLHHVWEAVCPPASVQADVLTTIHERRLKEGWKCLHETTSTVVYAHVGKGIVVNHIAHQRNIKQLRDVQRIWFPAGVNQERVPSNSDDVRPSGKDVAVDWGALLKDRHQQGNFTCRNSMRGPCVCLSVQYVQTRGEKPTIRCQIWADRSHPTWATYLDKAEFQAASERLCALE